jgi:hypothetical protein
MVARIATAAPDTLNVSTATRITGLRFQRQSTMPNETQLQTESIRIMDAPHSLSPDAEKGVQWESRLIG